MTESRATPAGFPAQSRRAWAVALAALVLFSAPWWLLLPRFGRIPHNDYWLVLAELLDEQGRWRADPLVWATVRSNEHRVALPALIYAGNVALTDGDNRLLSALALLALTGTGVVLLGSRPPSLRWPAGPSARSALLLGALGFAPAQAHSVVMGFSGSMWLFANLLSVGALCAGARHLRTGAPAPLALALACGTLGLFTYSTSVAVMPLLLATALALRRRASTLAPLAAGALAAVAAAAIGRVRPAGHPEPAFDPVAAGGFLLRYLGAPLAGAPLAAAALGALGLLAGAVLWSTRRRDGGELLPWALLQVWALLNALGTAIGRGGFVPDPSMSSRYSTVALLFWAGLAIPAATLAAGRVSTSPRRAAAAGGLAVAALAAVLWVRGAPVLAAHLRRAAAEGVSEAALRMGVDYRPALRPVTQAPGALLRLREALRARGHVPFERREPGLPGEPLVLERRGVSPERPVEVDLREMRRVRGGWEVAGEAGSELRWLLALDGQGRLCGLGAPGEPERDPVTLERGPGRPPRLRWTGYLAGCEPGTARPFALAGGDSRLRRVSGSGWRG